MLHPPVVSSQSFGGPVPSAVHFTSAQALLRPSTLLGGRGGPELDMFLSPDRLGSDKTAIGLGSGETVFPESKLC